jgi:putative Holliday junction resolvase
MHRIMGLDVGEKTIGVAVSDLLGLTAQGIKTIKRRDINNDIKIIKDFVEGYEVNKIIIGLPRNMDGTYGNSVDKIKEFGNLVKDRLKCSVSYWDERLSTVSAEKMLIDADMSRKKRRVVIDKIAAVIILQNYLDYNQNNRKDEI